ncbi:uncharacterized protein LOC134187868 isoform X2 [Corticium candelabrum]|uniref:uncharacterized protein LOC134187868 isoform X2 n=1 Tax=Corticium candelabrum TaxID=121492 RepID=UPI002E2602F7|nr:uncharacterized protein LOC134187868 isoform X2 [Corticium candelabrum]
MDCIERDIPTTREKAFKMLHDWYCARGRRCNLNDMKCKVTDLKRAGESDREEKRQILFPQNLCDDQRFYGREDELNEMKKKMFKNDIRFTTVSPEIKFCLLVIRGLGGIGKSSLAARFAVMFKDAYSDGVFFHNAETWAMLETSIRENLCELLAQQFSGTLDEMNKIFLHHIYRKSKILLLYDNVEDVDLLLRVLPHEFSNVHILVTTRCCTDNKLSQKADHVITLEYLLGDNALTALFGWAERSHPADEDEVDYARRLVTSPLIQGLPLAIAHIGTFIRQTNISCRNYYHLLKREEEEMIATALNIDKLLQYFHISHLRAPLAAVGVNHPEKLETLEHELIFCVTDNPIDQRTLLFAQFWMKNANYVHLTWQFDIDSVSPDALSVLEFASLLSSRNIPGNLLQLMAFSNSDRQALRRFSKSLTELLSHALITTVETNDNYRCDVHALIQSTVFHRLIRKPHILQAKLTLLSEHFQQIVPKGLHETRLQLKYSKFVEMIPHLYSVAERILTTQCDYDVCWDVVQRACFTSISSAHVDTGFRLCEKQLKILEPMGMYVHNECRLRGVEERLCSKVVLYTNALFQMGCLYEFLKRSASDALSYYLKAIDVMNIVLGDLVWETSLYLDVHTMMAQCHLRLGQIAESERIYLRLLDIYTLPNSTLSYPIYAISVMNELANVYMRAGQSDRAYDMYQQVLHEAQFIEGSDLIITKSKFNCAGCLLSANDYNGALELLGQVLTTMRQTLPADHADIAIVLGQLCRCYMDLGNISEATRMAEESVLVVRSTRDRDDPYVAKLVSRLADCYLTAGETTRAIKLYEECVETFRKYLPDTLLILCEALYQLGKHYASNGMLQRSSSFLQEAIGFHQSFRYEFNPGLIPILRLLGLNYFKADNAVEAENVFRQLLLICETNLPESFECASALRGLEACLNKQNRYAECLPLLLQYRNIVVQKFPPMSKDIAEACLRIGECCLKLQQLGEAEKALSDSIEIYSTIVPADDSHMRKAVKALVLLASLYEEKGDLREATAIYKQILNTLQKIPLIYVDTVDVLSKAAICLWQQHEYVEMLPFLLTLREIHSQQAPASVAMVETCDFIGVTYKKLHYWKEAEEAFSQSLEISQYVFPSGHAHISIVERNLHDVRQRLYGH